jgi:hypothetical protein
MMAFTSQTASDRRDFIPSSSTQLWRVWPSGAGDELDRLKRVMAASEDDKQPAKWALLYLGANFAFEAL